MSDKPFDRDTAGSTTAAGASAGREVDDLVADFVARVDNVRRDGVPSYPPLGGRTPWAEATEGKKLEQIVWESMSVWLGAGWFAPDADVGDEVIAVPGVAALEVIERHIDYDRLPAAQRARLEGLRAWLDAAPPSMAAPSPHEDPVATALQQIVGIGHFDEMLSSWREDAGRPWAGMPEAEKVKVIVDQAAEAGPPGVYTLEVIEREVDYGRLPPWRREALEDLRARLDRGELDGENPNPRYQGDRTELALRLTELGARVEDARQLGALDIRGQLWPWRELSEEQKFDLIAREIADLHLDTEAKAFGLIDREVDLMRVPEERRQAFEEAREEAWPGPAERQALHAELTHDYGLRREEERSETRENRAGPPRRSPAEIAAAARTGLDRGAAPEPYREHDRDIEL